MGLDRSFAPRQRAGVIQKIIADDDLSVAKRLPTDPRTLGGIGDDGDIDLAQPDDILAETGRKPQQVGPGLQQKDRRRQEVSAGKGGFADLPVQFFG